MICPLIVCFPRLFLLKMEQDYFINQIQDGTAWRWNWNHPIVGGTVFSHLMQFLDLLTDFNTFGFSDRWVQDAGGDDQFSVSHARRVIDDNYLSDGVIATRWNNTFLKK